jgi:hypothetical protein
VRTPVEIQPVTTETSVKRSNPYNQYVPKKKKCMPEDPKVASEAAVAFLMAKRAIDPNYGKLPTLPLMDAARLCDMFNAGAISGAFIPPSYEKRAYNRTGQYEGKGQNKVTQLRAA